MCLVDKADKENYVNLQLNVMWLPCVRDIELITDIYYYVYYKQMSSIYNYRRGPVISCHSWHIEIPT